MKELFESWSKFLTEQDFIGDLPLERDEEGNIILYHISRSEDITELDPEIAATNLKTYTQAEYRAWDRPRVFFFTSLGQEDTGIGRIEGIPYRVKLRPEQLYPFPMADPAGLSSRQQIQKYLVDNSPKFDTLYVEAEKCSSQEEYNKWHVCSKTPNSDGLAWYEERLRGKFLLIDNPRFHHIKPNLFELVAESAEQRFGTIGFVYPQSGDKNKIIVSLWRKVPAEKLDKDFY